MDKRSFIIAVIAALFFTFVNVNLAKCQENINTDLKQAEIAKVTNLSDLYEKSKELDSDRKDLEGKLKPICNVSSLESELLVLRENLSQYRQNYIEEQGKENSDVESMVALRGNVRILSAKYTSLETSAVGQLKNIEALKKEWESKNSFWQALQLEPNFSNNKSAKDVFGDADKIIKEALACFEGVDVPVYSIKQHINDAKKEAELLTSELDSYINMLRNRLFKKSANAMLSGKYFHEFNEKVKDDFFAGIAQLGNVADGFWSANAWILCLQLILIIAIAYYFKTVNNDRIQELGLGFLHKNYIASGLFLGTLIGWSLIEHCPVGLKLIFNIILGVSATIIVCGKYSIKRERTCIALIFSAYIAYKMCNFINMPMTLLRLFVAFASISLGIYLFKSNYNEPKEGEDKPSLIPLKERCFNKLLSVLLFVSFLGQLSGYSALSNHIFEISLKSVLIGLVAWIVLGVFKGCVALIIKSSILRKCSKIMSEHEDTIVARINWFLSVFIIFLAFSGIIATWGFFDNTWHAASSIMGLGFKIQDVKVTIGSIVWAILIFYIVICASWTVRTILEKDIYPKKNIDPGVGISINRLIYYSFICVAITFAMGILGISFQSLTVIVGALGVGIGFGLQNIVNNFASGLILLFERSIKVGDTVVVGGTWGTVKHLGLRATVIQTFANAEMIVPNSDLVSSTVNNWTMSNKKTRFSVNVGVAYGTDPFKVKQILLELAKAHKNVLSDPAPAVVFTEFGDSSLNFELRCWVSDIKFHWSTQDDLMYEIDKKFKENNIEIPFPQRDLYIKSLPEVSLKK